MYCSSDFGEFHRLPPDAVSFFFFFCLGEPDAVSSLLIVCHFFPRELEGAMTFLIKIARERFIF
jgi:hypothetical protein